ncbi:hypothetical protein HQ584_09575 [Patescibacteria group bacterium]|nr:hypothetical protein [Patescibacteria group bacterium]
MQDKLPWVDSLKINKGSAWPPIISGIIGGLVGSILLGFYQCIAFSVINTVIMGAIIGALYGRIFFGKKLEPIIASGIIGGIFGGVSGLGYFYAGFLFAYIVVAPLTFFSISYFRAMWTDEDFPLWFNFVIPICTLILVITARRLAPTEFSLGHAIAWGILSFIPQLNLGCLFGDFLAAGSIGWSLAHKTSIMYFFRMPFFAIPTFSFAGYFIGCKISEAKKPKEYVRKIPKGGLLMANDPAFPKDTSEDMSPIAFSEKVMIRDLLGALNNRNLLSVKLQSWGARAKGQEQIRAFEMIREMLQRETDIIQAYTANQQARLDFENLKEFNQYLQKERLKAQLAEEKYKQAEVEEKMKRMKLEEEKERLQLQQEIGRLKRAQGMTEGRIERLKKEQLEKVNFQEEIRKVKTMRLADRAEHLHNWKKKMKGKYSSEEAEDIIDEFDRMLVEEGLKEE